MTALTISIGRASLPGDLDPLGLSGTLDDVPLGIVNYQAPARLARVEYMPDRVDVIGSEAIGGAWQQAILGFDWMADTAEDETDVQAFYNEMVDALGQFAYPVTTQVSGAPAEVWAADMGSVTPPQRTFVDLEHPEVLVISVSIPVYPIPGSI